MARAVLENVRVDFPIYGAHRNLRKVLFERATGVSFNVKARIMIAWWSRRWPAYRLTLEDGDQIG